MGRTTLHARQQRHDTNVGRRSRDHDRSRNARALRTNARSIFLPQGRRRCQARQKDQRQACAHFLHHGQQRLLKRRIAGIFHAVSTHQRYSLRRRRLSREISARRQHLLGTAHQQRRSDQRARDHPSAQGPCCASRKKWF